MEYAYKPTTRGRAVMAACMALEKPVKITRVAFGSGKVGEDVNLADVHGLLSFISNGAVADRRHEGDRFFLTIQYANSEHRDVKMFLLTEFIVYTEDPETGIVSESPDDTGRSFAFGFQTTGDAGGMRTWVLENTATGPVHNPGTNTDSLTEDPDSATFTSKPHECADGKRRLSCFCEAGDAGYANFFAKVPFQVAATE